MLNGTDDFTVTGQIILNSIMLITIALMFGIIIYKNWNKDER